MFMIKFICVYSKMKKFICVYSKIGAPNIKVFLVPYRFSSIGIISWSLIINAITRTR